MPLDVCRFSESSHHCLASHRPQFANGTIYNDPTEPSGGQPGSDQYLWVRSGTVARRGIHGMPPFSRSLPQNYTNSSAASWVLERYVAALGDSLDGTFLDDNYFPEVMLPPW